MTAGTITFITVELGIIPYLYAVTKSLEESRGAPYTVNDLALALAALTLGAAFVLYGLLAALRRHARLTVAVAVAVVVILSATTAQAGDTSRSCTWPNPCEPGLVEVTLWLPIVAAQP